MNASDLKWIKSSSMINRIEENSIDTAVRKFADAVAKYNATQVEYDKNVKARVKGVLKTVLDKPDEEIDQVIESGQSIEAIRGVDNMLLFNVGNDGEMWTQQSRQMYVKWRKHTCLYWISSVHGSVESNVYGLHTCKWQERASIVSKWM